VAHGGLGLFEVKKFLQAQKLRWVLLANRDIDAGWKLTLDKSAIGDGYRYEGDTLAANCKILQDMTNALECFKKSYYNVGNNYIKGKIFGDCKRCKIRLLTFYCYTALI
jgi:hypothetical protein